jgi:hypothetical protein
VQDVLHLPDCLVSDYLSGGCSGGGPVILKPEQRKTSGNPGLPRQTYQPVHQPIPAT